MEAKELEKDVETFLVRLKENPKLRFVVAYEDRKDTGINLIMNVNDLFIADLIDGLIKASANPQIGDIKW